MNTKKRVILTLSLIHEHPRILLGMKKRGFGAGHWNGFGGKIAPGETIEEAAVRELWEETGIEAEPSDLERYGILEFEFQSEPDKVLEVHVYKVLTHDGDAVETEEMRPQWFMIDEIPFKHMWADDPYWMPLFIKGSKFRGRFLFDEPSTSEKAASIIEKEVRLVTDFE